MADAGTLVARGLRLARRDPDRAEDAEEGLEYLNEIHQAVLTDGTPWSFLVHTHPLTILAGTATIPFSAIQADVDPSGPAIERIVGMYPARPDVGQPRGMDLRQLELVAGGTLGQADSKGPLAAYAQVGLGTADPMLHLWPVPDRDTQVHVAIRPVIAELDAEDTPLVPDAHSAVLVRYVAAWMWRQQGGGEALNESMAHEAAHERALKRMVDAYGSLREDDGTFVEPTLYAHLEYGGRDW